MRAIIQRVKQASVTIEQTIKAQIGTGLLIFIGIGNSDNQIDIKWLSKKIANLRIFDDDRGVMNKSVMEIQGDILVVSQFTLFALTKKGARPSYVRAAKPDIAIPLYELFCSDLEKLLGQEVKTGVFGSEMQVSILNDGPVTIWIDTKNKE